MIIIQNEEEMHTSLIKADSLSAVTNPLDK